MTRDETMATSLAAVNAAWQRYTRASEQHHEPDLKNPLYSDFIAQWERLSTSHLAGKVLIYDPATLTFSLHEESAGTILASSDIPH